MRQDKAHTTAKEKAVRRQELRRSNAAVRHRNRFRERKSGKGQHGQAIKDQVDAG